MTTDTSEAFLATIIVALARTWDAKLPGFQSEFKSQIDDLCLHTPLSEMGLRTALDKLSQSLSVTKA
jgi:hypothetical protein